MNERETNAGTCLQAYPGGGVGFGLRVVGRGEVAVDGARWPYVRSAFWILAAPEMPPELAKIALDDEGTQTAVAALCGEALVMPPIVGGNLRSACEEILADAVEHRAPQWPARFDGTPFDFLAVALVLLTLGGLRDEDTARMERVGDTLRVDTSRARFALRQLHPEAEVAGEVAFAPAEGLPS